MSKHCLTIICSREVEDKLLDTLLTSVAGAVFTSTPTFSHGTAQGRMSNLEKVMGRSRAVQVQIVTSDEELGLLIEVLKLRFKGTGLRYWATPLSTEGEVA